MALKPRLTRSMALSLSGVGLGQKSWMTSWTLQMFRPTCEVGLRETRPKKFEHVGEKKEEKEGWELVIDIRYQMNSLYIFNSFYN